VGFAVINTGHICVNGVTEWRSHVIEGVSRVIGEGITRDWGDGTMKARHLGAGAGPFSVSREDLKSL